MEGFVKFVADVVTAGAAFVAIAISLFSLSYARRALVLAEHQEERRKPNLAAHLIDSNFVEIENGDRIYAVSLSVRNPSDSDNAISNLELHIQYGLDGGLGVIVKIPSILRVANSEDKRTCLVVPTRISAHNTVSGWSDFLVPAGVRDGRIIEAFELVITDSHQVDLMVDVLVVKAK
jgi:hypothetical protein